jgi:DNA-binding transcriptional LysR family regulator
MTLSQLQMFKMVAEQGSIARAAQLLHCVPSNITTRLKLLEEDLGVPLFIKKGRGLIVSPCGLIFLDYANDILSLCQQARQAVAVESVPSGALKIGAIESSATGRLPAILAKYHQQYPQVQMQFSTASWQQLLADVIDHKLDGAIIAVKPQHPLIDSIEIYQEALVLITSATELAIKEPADLAAKNVFMWPPGCPYRQKLEHWLAQDNVSLAITNIASYGTILGCVSGGAGVSLVPRGMFDQFKNTGTIKGYEFGELTPIKNYFISNKNVGPHRARQVFLELLTSEFLNSVDTRLNLAAPDTLA